MSLSLSCPCGAHFEVEETYAGQSVTCPDCQALVKAPSPHRLPLQTSGLALASIILALVGAFTIIFTLLGILLGLCALVSIARNGDALAGRGYAIFGIVAGVGFTVLSMFLYSNLELLPVDGFVEAGITSSQIDYSGDREVTRKDKGFAITRPSRDWGVAKKGLIGQFAPDSDLLLVNPHRHCYIEVLTVHVVGTSLDQLVDDTIKFYQANLLNEEDRPGRWRDPAPAVQGFRVRERRTLPIADDLRAIEVLIDQRVQGQDLSFVERFIMAQGQQNAYHLRAWTARRRYTQMEGEMRRAFDSFRLLR